MCQPVSDVIYHFLLWMLLLSIANAHMSWIIITVWNATSGMTPKPKCLPIYRLNMPICIEEMITTGHQFMRENNDQTIQTFIQNTPKMSHRIHLIPHSITTSMPLHTTYSKRKDKQRRSIHHRYFTKAKTVSAAKTYQQLVDTIQL